MKRDKNITLSIIKYKLNPKHLVHSWKRRLLARKKKDNKANKKASKRRFFTINKIRTRYLVVLAMLAIILIFGIHLREYYQISPHKYNEQAINRAFSSPDYNVAILVKEQNSESTFIQGITIISINSSDKQIKTVGISTDVIAKNSYNSKLYTLKTLYNQIPSEEEALLEYLEVVEKTTGIRIDRYIIIDVESIDLLAQRYSLTTKAASTVNAEGREFKKGSKVESRFLTSYLFNADENEKQVLNIAEFFKGYLQDQTGLWGSYLAFWRSDIILNNSHTDLSKSEFFSWIDLLGSANFSEVFVFGESISTQGSTGVEDGLFVDNIKASESLREYFRSFSILTEQAQVELYNATPTSGLASSLQKKLDVYGINVVKIGNSTEGRVNSKVNVYSDVENPFPNTLALIKKTIQTEVVEVEYFSTKESGNYAGDIVIILGEDSI